MSVSIGVNGAHIKDTTTGNTTSDNDLAGLSEALSRPVENTTQDLQSFVVSAESPSVDTELPMGTNLKRSSSFVSLNLASEVSKIFLRYS